MNAQVFAAVFAVAVSIGWAVIIVCWFKLEARCRRYRAIHEQNLAELDRLGVPYDDSAGRYGPAIKPPD